jgi:chemotaxis protein CheC
MTGQVENTQKQSLETKDSALAQETDGDLMDVAILSELASMGAGHAATSLSELLQQPVTIEVPRVHRAPAHLLLKEFGLHETPTTALYISLASGPECDILLMLEADEARKVAAMMTMTPVEELDPSMEASATEELANILVGSFLSAISDFAGLQLMTAPPERIVDAFDSILDFILAKNSMLYSEILLFDILFKASEKVSRCMLLAFPSPEMQRNLVEKSKVMAGADMAEPSLPTVGT